MTESSKPPSWDGQPTTLARHMVKLEEDYAEHGIGFSRIRSSRRAWSLAERGKIYVHNALHALVRMSPSFSTLSISAKP
jgi:hypothetical protein